jgi:hypothetical protein
MKMNKCIHIYQYGIKKGEECNNKVGKEINNFLLLCKKHYCLVRNDPKKSCNKIKDKLLEFNINITDYFYQKIDYYGLKYSYEISSFLNILVNFCLSENEMIDILNYLLKKKIKEEWIIKVICEVYNICKYNEEYDLFNLINLLIEKQICYIKILLLKNSLLPSEINTLILNHLKNDYLEKYINMIKETNKDKDYEYFSNIILALSELKF